MIELASDDLFREETIDEVEEMRIILKVLLLGEFSELFVIGFREGLQGEESDIISYNITFFG